eukprot:gene17529-6350_t
MVEAADLDLFFTINPPPEPSPSRPAAKNLGELVGKGVLYSPGYSPSPLKPKKVPSNTHGTMPFSPKHQKPAASPVTNLFFDAYGDVSPEKTAKSFGKSPGLAGSSIGRDWTFEEVCEWLEANDVYNDFIIENELDGADMLELTVGDLGGVLGFARPV